MLWYQRLKPCIPPQYTVYNLGISQLEHSFPLLNSLDIIGVYGKEAPTNCGYVDNYVHNYSLSFEHLSTVGKLRIHSAIYIILEDLVYCEL